MGDDPQPTNSRTVICIGDLHGYITKLQNLWFNLESTLPPLSFQSSLIIFLGDYCDRGPDTKQVLSFLISLPAKYPNQTHVFLCGNHDFAFSAFLGLSSLTPAGRIELVKSVLQGMAVYTMMIYYWPKSLVKKLQMMAINFIWTGDILKKGFVTISWKRMCAPVTERGLGIRNLLEFNKAGMIKLAWEFLRSKKIWCELIRARFYSAGRPISYYKPSSVWKGVVEGLDLIAPDVCWQIGKDSKCRFWTDRWVDGESIAVPVPTLLFGTRDCKVGEFVQDGEWRLPELFIITYPVLAAQIQDIAVPMEEEDRLIWKPAQNGEISTKQSYEHYRNKRTEAVWMKNVWRKYIPPKVSFFVWKILNVCLQTDENRRERGAVTVSFCSNCPHPSSAETTQHLLYECPLAVELLTWVSQAVNKDLRGFASVEEMIQWVVSKQMSRRATQVRQCLVFFTLWELWKERNGRRIHNRTGTVLKLIARVRHMMQRVVFLLDGYSGNEVSEFMMMRSLNIPAKFKITKPPTEIYWVSPPPSWHKVNFDGAAKGQPGHASCGGVFRNGRGFLRGSYAAPLGIQTSIVAEMMGFVWAVKIAKIKGWFPLWIESDSMVVVTKVRAQSLDVPWSIRSKWINCLEILKGQRFYISHIYREGNIVADVMANEGLLLTDFTWWYGLPIKARPAYERNLCNLAEYRFHS